ncbi:hypothetical protein QY96_03536 [Bacillus thermotolerans]|nr:hypothetical protein QY96_03536 [Bacillus thermotolerans]
MVYLDKLMGSIIHVKIERPVLFNFLVGVRKEHKKTSSFTYSEEILHIFSLFVH